MRSIGPIIPGFAITIIALGNGKLWPKWEVSCFAALEAKPVEHYGELNLVKDPLLLRLPPLPAAANHGPLLTFESVLNYECRKRRGGGSSSFTYKKVLT